MKLQHMTIWEGPKSTTCGRCGRSISTGTKIVTEHESNMITDKPAKVMHASCAAPNIEAQLRAADHLRRAASASRQCGYQERKSSPPCTNSTNIRIRYEHPGTGPGQVEVCRGHGLAAKERLASQAIEIVEETSLS